MSSPVTFAGRVLHARRRVEALCAVAEPPVDMLEVLFFNRTFRRDRRRVVFFARATLRGEEAR